MTMPEVPKASLGPCPLAPHLNEDPNSAETPEQDAFSPMNEDVVSVQSNHLKSIPFSKLLSLNLLIYSNDQ